MPTPRPSEETMAAWQALLAVHAQLTAELDTELKHAHALPLELYDVLYQLSQHGGRMRMQDLAEALLVSRSSCTRLVDRLDYADMVHREEDPHDLRGRWAVLTQKGRGALRRAAPTHLAGIEARFGSHLDAATARTISTAFRSMLEA